MANYLEASGDEWELQQRLKETQKLMEGLGEGRQFRASLFAHQVFEKVAIEEFQIQTKPACESDTPVDALMKAFVFHLMSSDAGH